MMLPVARFAPCGLAELTADGVIISINDILLSWLGAPREDVVGHELFEFVNDEMRTLRNALQSDEWDGTPFTLSASLHNPAHTRPLLLASSSYFVEGEQRMSVVFFDATASNAIVDRTSDDRDLAQRVNARLNVLVDTAEQFSRAATEAEIAERLVEAVKASTGADEVATYLLAENGSFTQLAGSNPLLENYPPDAPTIAAEAFRTGEPVLLANPEAAAAFAPGWDLAAIFEDAAVHAVIVSPIVDQAQIGAVAAFFRSPQIIDDQMLPLTGALARAAGQVFTRLRLEAEARQAANRDLVTGLANRRLLEERSATLAQSTGALLAVLFLDLDKFKQVNDERGHAVGDELLGEVGRRISAIVREQDSVARYGGDEFVAVCEVPDEPTALAIAERIREAIARPYDGPLEAVPVKASIGVAIAGTPVSVERLIRAADLAMYEAKGSGGNVVKRSDAA